MSPASDEGWLRQHDQARIALEKHYGKRIAITTVENISAGADCERVLSDLAQQGNKLIFATSFGFMNAVLKVAQAFPEVKFEHATGYRTTENVGNYTARFYSNLLQQERRFHTVSKVLSTLDFTAICLCRREAIARTRFPSLAP